MKSVIGYEHPLFKIYNGSTIVDKIELDLTDSDGLIESYAERNILQELNDYSVLKKVYGLTIHFDLSYAALSKIDNTLKIQDLWRYNKLGYRFILYPRSEKLTRSFEVYWSGDNWEIDNVIGEEGMKDLKIQFTTVNLVSDMGWEQPPPEIHTPASAVFNYIVI